MQEYLNLLRKNQKALAVIVSEEHGDFGYAEPEGGRALLELEKAQAEQQVAAE